MDEAEQALGREGGRADGAPRAVALLSWMCPRILLQGAVGKGKEIQFVGSSWLLVLLHFN